jgi:hypothetical protein
MLTAGANAAGVSSEISSAAEAGSTGAGGTVNIRAQNIVFRDRGAVATSKAGQHRPVVAT